MFTHKIIKINQPRNFGEKKKLATKKTGGGRERKGRRPMDARLGYQLDVSLRSWYIISVARVRCPVSVTKSSASAAAFNFF